MVAARAVAPAVTMAAAMAMVAKAVVMGVECLVDSVAPMEGLGHWVVAMVRAVWAAEAEAEMAQEDVAANWING